MPAATFRRILCPLDFAPNTPIIVEMARQIVAEDRGTVIFFHVVPMPTEAIGQPLMVEPLTGAEADARKRLERIAADSHVPSYEIVVVTGEPSVSILEVAEEQRADLIVMATHGRTGLSHFLLGSVAERVVRESPIPVMTVRAPTSKHHLLHGSVLFS